MSATGHPRQRIPSPTTTTLIIKFDQEFLIKKSSDYINTQKDVGADTYKAKLATSQGPIFTKHPIYKLELEEQRRSSSGEKH